MTFFLVKEKIAEGKFKLEDKVKVSVTASSEEGSSLDLKAGEEISVKDLLDGLMIVSGNDAAVALAELVGETESKTTAEIFSSYNPPIYFLIYQFLISFKMILYTIIFSQIF